MCFRTVPLWAGLALLCPTPLNAQSVQVQTGNSRISVNSGQVRVQTPGNSVDVRDVVVDPAEPDLTDAPPQPPAIGRRERNARPMDFTNQDLPGVVWAGRDLAGAKLVNVNLRGADLRGANLAGADLTNADLTAANLADANLRGARLVNVDLDQALLANAIWVDGRRCSPRATGSCR